MGIITDTKKLEDGDLLRSKIRLETFFKNIGILYLPYNGLLKKNTKLHLSIEPLYKVFFSAGDKTESVDILLGIQSTRGKTKEVPEGYIYEWLSLLKQNFSRQESLNTLYCSYSLDDDVMIFKPLYWMLRYHDTINPSSSFSNQQESRKSGQLCAIRVEPMSTEEMKQKNPGKIIMPKETRAMKSFHPMSKNGKMNHSYHIGVDQPQTIAHFKPLTIEENEMESFFKEHNYYPEGWKLQMKVVTNLLTQGALI